VSLIRKYATIYNLKCGKCGMDFCGTYGDQLLPPRAYTTKRSLFETAASVGWKITIMRRKKDRRCITGHKILCTVCRQEVS
jgi:hypothetical protein